MSVLSRLYDCELIHSRTYPKSHRFFYRYFMFCLDLDEIQILSRRSLFFGTSFIKIFRFLPRDFFLGDAESVLDLKNRILSYVESKGVLGVKRVEILGHVRTFGYAYNPACFYFCYHSNGQLMGVVLNVTNTFRERKIYWISIDPAEALATGALKKHFYVSPFVALDSVFHCRLEQPADRLKIQIDSRSNDQSVVFASLTGRKKDFSDWGLFWFATRFPFLPLLVMTKIHYQAFRLYLKGVFYHRKSESPELQKGGLS